MLMRFMSRYEGSVGRTISCSYNCVYFVNPNLNAFSIFEAFKLN